jgi:hypothetical protein
MHAVQVTCSLSIITASWYCATYGTMSPSPCRQDTINPYLLAAAAGGCCRRNAYAAQPLPLCRDGGLLTSHLRWGPVALQAAVRCIVPVDIHSSSNMTYAANVSTAAALVTGAGDWRSSADQAVACGRHAALCIHKDLPHMGTWLCRIVSVLCPSPTLLLLESLQLHRLNHPMCIPLPYMVQYSRH